MLPLLKIAADGKEHQIQDATNTLADQFGLTEEERKQLLPRVQVSPPAHGRHGVDRIFRNRIGWKSSDFPAHFTRIDRKQVLGETEEVEVIVSPSGRWAATQGEDEECESPERAANLAAIPIPQMLLWPLTEYRPIPRASAPATIVMLNKSFLSHSGELGWPAGKSSTNWAVLYRAGRGRVALAPKTLALVRR
jgi:Mrr N-terminal domain